MGKCFTAAGARSIAVYALELLERAHEGSKHASVALADPGIRSCFVISCAGQGSTTHPALDVMMSRIIGDVDLMTGGGEPESRFDDWGWRTQIRKKKVNWIRDCMRGML